MGRALHEEGFQKSDAPSALDEALGGYRKQLMRVQVELAELKRTGSHQGLAELTSEALILSMRMKRLEYLLEEGQDLAWLPANPTSSNRLP
jgi:hypothetical protein